MNTHALVNKELPREIEELSHAIIGCAIEAHRHLGPGLLEKLYEDALVYELRAAGFEVGQQVPIAVRYKETILRGQTIDLLVGGLIVVELKSIARIEDVHRAQTLSYLRAAGKPLGLLMNFNVPQLRDGLHRVYNERWNHTSSA